MAGGSRSENLAAHTLQEFLGVSSLPNLKGKALGTRLLPATVSVIHLSCHSHKYEGKIHAGQKKGINLNKKRARADCRFKLTRQRL